MVDVTVVQEFMLEVIPAVATVGVAVLGIKWLVQALKMMREQVGYTDDQYHAHRSANEASAEQADPWSGYTALDDARDRAAAGLGVNENWAESAEIQSGASGLTPVYRPATPEEAASWAEINAKFDAQEAADAAFFGAMTPYEKYLAKATPEDLARDAELEAEIAAEDERIARKYGLGGTHQGEVKVPKLGSGWGA